MTRTALWLLRLGLPVLALALAGGREAFACASCYGLADGPLIDAARLGVWLLLGVTLAIQGGFLAFFLYLRRRAAKTADEALDAEWSRLQHSWDRAGRGI
jgi:hypothetical protein